MREWKLFAEQGYASAQTNLGVMYNNGEGVLPNYVRAHMGYNIAATSGESKNTSKNRDIITKQMILNQIETARDSCP